MGKVEKSPYDLLQESLTKTMQLIERNSQGIRKIDESIGVGEEEKKQNDEAQKNNTLSSQLSSINKQLELSKYDKLKSEIEKMCFYFKKGTDKNFENRALKRIEREKEINLIADYLIEEYFTKKKDKDKYHLVIEGHANKTFFREKATQRSISRAKEVEELIKFECTKLLTDRQAADSFDKIIEIANSIFKTIRAEGRSYAVPKGGSGSSLNDRVTFVFKPYFLRDDEYQSDENEDFDQDTEPNQNSESIGLLPRQARGIIRTPQSEIWKRVGNTWKKIG